MDNGTYLILYTGELRKYGLQEGARLPEEQYRELYYDVFGKRVKKRALALLEKMDRSEKNLRDKLRQNDYPEDLIEEAIAYTKQYHYIDDARYAEQYVACRQGEKSTLQLRQELMRKGIDRAVIDQVMEEGYVSDDREKIIAFLKKRGYDPEKADRSGQQKIYASLMRKGFRSEDILSCMKCSDYLT
ncbi:MAG: regulatory protein RecX [Roseburia sp.]